MLFAIHGFRWLPRCLPGPVVVKVGSGVRRLSYGRAVVADAYNFDPGKRFSQYEQLARDGWAADFQDVGQTATFVGRFTLATFDVNALGVPIA